MISVAAAVLVGGLLLVASAKQADASAISMKITASGGFNSGLITDNGAGDTNAAAGVITYSGTAGGSWIVNTTTGIGSSVLGPPQLIHLDSVDVSSTTAGSLTIMLTQTGLSGAAGIVQFLTTIGGVAASGATVVLDAYIDLANTAFGLAAQIADINISNAGAISAVDVGSAAIDDLYSMTLVATITHTQPFTVTSFNAGVEVPEPLSLSLLGAGLLCLGLASRRRRTAAEVRAS